MQYDPEYLARFYDAYDLAEWDRLEVPGLWPAPGGHSCGLHQAACAARGPGGRHRLWPGALRGRGRHARGGADPG